MLCFLHHPSARCSFRSLISDLSVCVRLSGCLQWKPGLSRNCICYSWPATIAGGRVFNACQLDYVQSSNALIDKFHYDIIWGIHLGTWTEKCFPHLWRKYGHQEVALSFLTLPCHTHVKEQLEKWHNGNWNNAVMHIETQCSATHISVPEYYDRFEL